MSMHILDTDILSHYQRDHPKVAARAKDHPPNEVAITIITVEEQLGGWYTELRRVKGAHALAHIYERMTTTVRFFSRLQIITFSEAAIQRYGDLTRLKLGIRKTDLRIAAIVLEHGATLVSRNLRDFQRVPGLRLEDWTQ